MANEQKINARFQVEANLGDLKRKARDIGIERQRLTRLRDEDSRSIQREMRTAEAQAKSSQKHLQNLLRTHEKLRKERDKAESGTSARAQAERRLSFFRRQPLRRGAIQSREDAQSVRALQERAQASNRLHEQTIKENREQAEWAAALISHQKAELDRLKALESEKRSNERSNKSRFRDARARVNTLMQARRQGIRIKKSERLEAEEELKIAGKLADEEMQAQVIRRRGAVSGALPMRNAGDFLNYGRANIGRNVARARRLGQIGTTAGRIGGVGIGALAGATGDAFQTLGVIGGLEATVMGQIRTGAGSLVTGLGQTLTGAAFLAGASPAGLAMLGTGTALAGLYTALAGAQEGARATAIPMVMQAASGHYRAFSGLQRARVATLPFSDVARHGPGSHLQNSLTNRLIDTFGIGPTEALRMSSGFGRAAGYRTTDASPMVEDMARFALRGIGPETTGMLGRSFVPGGARRMEGAARGGAHMRLMGVALGLAVQQGMEAAQIPEHLQNIASFTGQVAERGFDFNPETLHQMVRAMGGMGLEGARGMRAASGLQGIFQQGGAMQSHPVLQYAMLRAAGMGEGRSFNDVLATMQEGFGANNGQFTQSFLQQMVRMGGGIEGGAGMLSLFGGIPIPQARSMLENAGQFTQGELTVAEAQKLKDEALMTLPGPPSQMLEPQRTAAEVEARTQAMGEPLVQAFSDSTKQMLSLQEAISQNIEPLNNNLRELTETFRGFLEDFGVIEGNRPGWFESVMRASGPFTYLQGR